MFCLIFGLMVWSDFYNVDVWYVRVCVCECVLLVFEIEFGFGIVEVFVWMVE